ncbi:hypothetical protein Zm00014a_011835 [Zea mays]|uniref:60S ribosomal protein L29 n=1 Tax=Zea mays TaxID=4577 RepID=A0A3L6F6B5_MAIZE|nr:hypothetical protein Zm00014a_011835 [Zea mays]
MAKSKDHMAHNQSYKAHKNNIKKPTRGCQTSTKGGFITKPETLTDGIVKLMIWHRTIPSMQGFCSLGLRGLPGIKVNDSIMLFVLCLWLSMAFNTNYEIVFLIISGMMRTIWSPDGPNKIHPDVDLTAPDAGRPDDDPAWFCLRVGCDQSHERVDPEALDRSFFMRVMAARSPNKKQSAQIDVTAQQLGEPRPAFNNGIQRKAVEPERVSRAASSTRKTKPARGLPAPPPSRTGKERKVVVKLSRFQTAAA